MLRKSAWAGLSLSALTAGVLVLSEATATPEAASATPPVLGELADSDKAIADSQQRKRGTVRFTHETLVVVSCKAEEVDGKVSCEPDKTETRDSGATIKLTPMQDLEKDERKPLEITFENQPKKVERLVKLDPGKWEILWKSRATLKDRFMVRAGDEYDIVLESTQGVCVPSGEKCELDPEKRHQSVEIPADRGL